MPLVDGKQMSPEDAIAAGYCPETGIALKGVNIDDHIARTWGPIHRHDPAGSDALARIKMLRAFKKAHPELHPQYDDNNNLIEEVV